VTERLASHHLGLYHPVGQGVRGKSTVSVNPVGFDVERYKREKPRAREFGKNHEKNRDVSRRERKGLSQKHSIDYRAITLPNGKKQKIGEELRTFSFRREMYGIQGKRAETINRSLRK